MRRLASFFLIIAMIFTLAACESNTGAATETKIVMVTDGAMLDGDFNELAWTGLSDGAALMEKLGSVSYIEGVTENLADIVGQEISSGANVIWASNSSIADDILALAEQHPDVFFIINDYYMEAPPANVSVIHYDVSDVAFLMGYLAAQTTETGVVGFVGGKDISSVNAFRDSFERGVKYVSTSIEIITAYAGSFMDGRAGYYAAEIIYGQGADVIFQVAGLSGWGVIECAQDLGKWVIGVDSDQTELAPANVLSSALKDIYPGTKDMAVQIFSGYPMAGRVYTMDMKSGAVDIASNNGNIPAELYDELMDVRSKLLSGSIKAASAPENVVGKTIGTGEIVILHTNDTHGRVSVNMSISSVAALKAQYESEGATVLVLDGGDTLHGLPIATLSKGETITEFFNFAGYDVMVPGNHDFNYGTERLTELADMLDASYICANLVDASTGKLIFQPYTIIEKNGVKFGIFGLTTPESGLARRDEIKITDCVTTAKTVVNMLQAQNVDYIIGLTHVGLLEDLGVTSEMIANEVPGIDVIIDAHSHTVLEEGLLAGDTLIASTGEYLNNIGVVTISPEGVKEAHLLNAEAYSETVEELDALLNEKNAEANELLADVVAYTPVTLDGERIQVRGGETNFGHLVADAIREATGSEAVIIAGGGIRASIAAGDVSMNDILTAFPFYNYVVEKLVPGQAIINALEDAVTFYPEPDSGFPHISGITFTFDAGAEPGSKVSNVMIGGESIDPERMYTFSTNDYTAGGGDYPYFAPCETTRTFGALEGIILDYINSIDMSQYETVVPRITILNDAVAQLAA